MPKTLRWLGRFQNTSTRRVCRRPQKTSTLTWIPHTTQSDVILSSQKFSIVILACGRRWGKTELAVNKLIRASWEDPGDYVYIAPTTKQGKRILWRKLKDFFPEKIRDGKNWKNEVELYVQNTRGGRVTILGADNPDSLRGEGWKGAVLDEFSDHDRNTVNTIAPALADYDGWMWIIGTPKGHDHFYEWFIRDPDRNDPTYRTIDDEPVLADVHVKSFHYITRDNPHVSIEFIERFRKLYSPEWFAQEFEASFENYMGLVYREFLQSRDRIVLKSEVDSDGKAVACIMPDGERINFTAWMHWYQGIDTGRVTGWINVAVDDKGREFIVNEVYDCDGLVQDISEKIKRMTSGYPQRGGVIDSASQVKNEYRNHGHCWSNSRKDVMNSVQTTRRKFSDGLLYVLDCCPAMIRELGSRKWDEKRKGKPQPKKEHDHLCNALDYLELNFLAGMNSDDQIRDAGKHVMSEGKRYDITQSLRAVTCMTVKDSSWEDFG